MLSRPSEKCVLNVSRVLEGVQTTQPRDFHNGKVTLAETEKQDGKAKTIMAIVVLTPSQAL